MANVLSPDSPTIPTGLLLQDIYRLDRSSSGEKGNRDSVASGSTVSTSIMSSSEYRKSTPSDFFELRRPATRQAPVPDLEKLMERIHSAEHLHFILSDLRLSRRFSTFVNRYKLQYSTTLVRYLGLRKAHKAIEYANAVVKSIRHAKLNPDLQLEEQTKKEFEILRSEVLPAFVTMALVDHVSEAVSKDVRGEDDLSSEYLSELAEVFCLTDPRLSDNPIIYATEEFHRMTHYGTAYTTDRNCRFLQGPGTDKNSTKRISQAIKQRGDSNETILNYRRDGSPFVNLLTCAPLYDDMGKVCYYLGAQVDVTNLIIDGRGLESFRQLLQSTPPSLPSSMLNLSGHGIKMDIDDIITHPQTKPTGPVSQIYKKDREILVVLQELSQYFNHEEVETVARHGNRHNLWSPSNNAVGGSLSSLGKSDSHSISETWTPIRAKSQVKRVTDSSPLNTHPAFSAQSMEIPERLARPGSLTVYKHYVLVRPFPSLRILFASPSMRTPGLLRTPLFSKLGGSPQTLDMLLTAFQDNASITAKLRWLPDMSMSQDLPGLPPILEEDQEHLRWMRATPLLGSDDKVGVWICVFVPMKRERDVLSAPNTPSNSVISGREARRVKSISLSMESKYAGLLSTKGSIAEEKDATVRMITSNNEHSEAIPDSTMAIIPIASPVRSRAADIQTRPSTSTSVNSSKRFGIMKSRDRPSTSLSEMSNSQKPGENDKELKREKTGGFSLLTGSRKKKLTNKLRFGSGKDKEKDKKVHIAELILTELDEKLESHAEYTHK